MINAVGLQGPGVERWLADELPALAGHRRSRRRQHLGPQRRRLPTGGRTAGRGAGGGRCGRGQPVVPEPGGSSRHLRPRRRAVGRGHRGHGGVPVGRAGRSSARTPIAWWRWPRPCSEAGAEAVTLVEHPARHGARPAHRPARCSAPAAVATAAGRCTPWRCAPCTTCTPRCPTCPSSASAACRRAGTPPSCCSPVPARCRSARPRSPIQRAPLRVQTRVAGVVRRAAV